MYFPLRNTPTHFGRTWAQILRKNLKEDFDIFFKMFSSFVYLRHASEVKSTRIKVLSTERSFKKLI
jgi:hypothetical protein